MRRPRHFGDKLLVAVIVLTVLLLLASVGLALRPGAKPMPVGTPAIVFVCGKAGFDLCRVDPSGGGLKRLTTDGTEAEPYASPSLTPDGRQLAFVHGGRAYLASTRDLSERRVLDQSGHAVAVALRDDGHGALVTREVQECYGSDETDACVTKATLIVLSIDGEAPSMLDRKLGAGYADYLPGDDRLVAEKPEMGLDKLYVLPLIEGPPGPPEPLPDHLIEVSGGFYRIIRPEVSSVVRQIAATQYTDNWENGGMAIFSASTGELVRVLDESTLSRDPAWSPDGRQLVFTRSEWLHVAPATGGAAQSLGVRGREPTWGGL